MEERQDQWLTRSSLAGLIRALEADAYEGKSIVPVSENYQVHHEGPGEPAHPYILSRLIVKAYREGGFLLALIWGNLGQGKSIYAIKAARRSLMDLGMIPASVYKLGSTYEYVFRHYLVYRLQEFFPIYFSANWKNRVPVLIWDDAGVYLSKYRHNEWIKIPTPDGGTRKIRFAQILSSLFDLIRTRIAAVIMTAPTPTRILKLLRDMEMYSIPVRRVEKWYSIAVGYKVKVNVLGKQYARKEFIDGVVIRLPDRVYQAYMELRDKAYIRDVEELARLAGYFSEEDAEKGVKRIDERTFELEV